MQLDWTTFVLEIVNFLILLWILKRFLYRPVRNAIARRQAAVADTIAQAQAQVADAQALRTQYEGRMQAWDSEREAARARLAEDLDRQREREIAAIRTAVASEREKSQAVEARRLQEQTRTLREQAADQATAFAGALLERLSGPELDRHIARIVVEDLDALDEAQRSALQAAAAAAPRLEICSAHALPDDIFARLRDAVARQLGTSLEAARAVDPGLGGGVRIAVGPWLLETTLAHELAHFRDRLKDES